MEDVIQLRGKPFNHTVRGVAVEQAGEVIAIAGVMHTVPLQAFTEASVDQSKYPMTVMRTVRKFREILKGYKVPVYALADPKQRNAPAFLERVGFQFEADTAMGKVYKWQTQ